MTFRNWSQSDIDAYNARISQKAQKPSVMPAIKQALGRSNGGGGIDTLAPRGDSASCKATKPSKYKNQSVVIDGIKFQSIKEGNEYKKLKLMEKAGEIFDLKLQVPFIICPSVVLDGKNQRPVKYVADFSYIAKLDMIDNQVTVVDVKGFRTPEYKIKRKLMKHVFGIDIIEI